MPFSLLTSVKASGRNTLTTPAIDTSGASLIVVQLSAYAGSGTPTLIDSKGNTWSYGTAQTSGGTTNCRIAYCLNPIVGTGHTFTPGSSDYYTVVVAAWSGANTSSSFDQQNGSTTKSPGSVAPSEDNELVICGINGYDSTGTPSCDGGFTLIDYGAYSSGVNFAGAMFYLIQTSAASANPTMTWSASSTVCSDIATFKAAAASGQPAMRRLGLAGNRNLEIGREGVRLMRSESGLMLPDRRLITPRHYEIEPELRTAL